MEYEGVGNEAFDYGAMASGTAARDLHCQLRSVRDPTTHEGTEQVQHTPQGHLIVYQKRIGTSMDAGLGRWIEASRIERSE